MIFELISWIFITLTCLIWGNQVLKLFFEVDSQFEIDFPVVCFVGMSVIGIVSLYISLFTPLFRFIKLALMVPAFLILLRGESRMKILFQVKKAFDNYSISEYVFLISILVMILFLSTSQIIHPDTLNYHAFSTWIFDKYSTIPGIANLNPVFGFQSMWFAAMAVFDFPRDEGPWSPLNGCAMIWLAVFLVSKGKNMISYPDQPLNRVWYLVLILFSILSWTQIRLTASSLSPDFIATISIWLGFYFFIAKKGKEFDYRFELLAAFFSVIAVVIKLSAIPVLLIPAIIFCQSITKERFLLTGRISLVVLLLLAPLVIRNIISSGYPFYPSVFASIHQADWKLDENRILEVQRYITAYARYPSLSATSGNENNNTFSNWLPLWWKHLYLVDKTLIGLVVLGVPLNLLFLRNFKSAYSGRTLIAFVISIVGLIFWFANAPDPRFGTGFLIPASYFLYYPFSKYPGLLYKAYLGICGNWIVKIASVFIILYIGYREVYFFHSRQLIFPEGIKNDSSTQNDCNISIRKMILNGTISPAHFPDSCKLFRFRGSDVKQGFKPLH